MLQLQLVHTNLTQIQTLEDYSVSAQDAFVQLRGAILKEDKEAFETAKHSVLRYLSMTHIEAGRAIEMLESLTWEKVNLSAPTG